MGGKHEGIEVRDNFIATFYGGTDLGCDFGVHPGFDDAADCVVVFVGFETVYCEAGGVTPKLDPAKKKFRGWLRAFETAYVVAVAL